MDPCFQRDLPGKWKLSEGIPGEIINFLKKAKAEACYQIKFLDAEQHHVVFELERGNVVFESFDIDEAISKIYKLEIKALNGYVTIIDELDPAVIYDRIRYQYGLILKNCLGKSLEDQMKYLGMKSGEEHWKHLGTKISINYKIGADYISNSASYIRGLVSNPTDHQKKEIIDHILSGSLEYGNHSEDVYSVEMHQYAKALANKLGYTLA